MHSDHAGLQQIASMIPEFLSGFATKCFCEPAWHLSTWRPSKAFLWNPPPAGMLWPTEKESIRIWTTSEVAWGLYDIACVTLDKQGIGDGHLPKSSEHKRQNAPRRRRATGTPAEHLMLAARAHSHRGRWRQCWPPSSQQPQQKQARGKEEAKSLGRRTWNS